jgi:glycerophosphoryl diester phosphodiesterase
MPASAITTKYKLMKLFFSALWCLTICTTMLYGQSFSWNNNPVIAHRGAWKKNNLPENSIASLKEAIRLQCYGAEFDVHQTKDGVLVINHDDTFQGLPIGTTTYKELKKHLLDNGEEIPTLDSYLKEGMKQGHTKLILEIKPDKNPVRMLEITDAVVAMVQKRKAAPWVEYISFDYACLKRVLELDPAAKVAYLNGDVPAEKLKLDGFTGVDYHYTIYKTNNWFADAKKLGLTLNAWTVNTAEDMQWLLDHKAEFITTNEPELLFEILKQRT